MPTINLGRKDDCCTAAPCDPVSAKEPRISYPSLRVSTDSDDAMPEGEFTATVKLKTKSGEWSEDESGKRKCSYCFDVMEITPVVTKRSRSEKKEPDAAEAIMEGMKRVRGSKVMQGDGE